MTFALTYEPVTRRPNPMVKINPLRRGTGRTVSLQDRIDRLEQSAVWKRTMRAWQVQNKRVDLARMPRVAMVPLGQIEIDEDIQRQLDEKHCANKIADVALFDPALLQTLQCIKTSGGKYKNVDGQHTASTVAGLISAGLLDGVDDWRKFEFPVQYIETDNLAFARRAFSILNGKGKKKQSAYQQLRNAVFIVRIDNDVTDEEDVELEHKVSTVEQHNCFPVEADSDLARHPGTFTNIATFKTLNSHELAVACGWHNQYFHYEAVHVSLFFVWRDICRQFDSAKIAVTDQLQLELAAMVQSCFGNLSQFQESVTEAHRRWTLKRYGYQAAWDDDAYACALMQLYQHFGGQQRMAPTLLDHFDGLIDFFDQDILNMAV